MWQGEVCKRCGRRNCIGFEVTSETWQRVVRGEFNVLCTTCFDELAEARGVAYSFQSVWPVSWSQWQNDGAEPSKETAPIAAG